MRDAARTMGVELLVVDVLPDDEFGQTLTAMTRKQPDALIVPVQAVLLEHYEQIVDFAVRNRLPTVYGFRESVEAGGLMSYGPSYTHMFRRAAVFVDKILKRTKPGDLPIERPTQFELVINMKAAKALGLTVPPSLLLRADQVIE